MKELHGHHSHHAHRAQIDVPADSAAHSCCSSKKAEAPDTATSAGLKGPVCGMTVTAQSPHVLEHEGQRVHFWSAGCKT